ncbi:hypothetical protein [Granulicella tundricola]|nr:hypothetical protein [Granulicella tundricola]
MTSEDGEGLGKIEPRVPMRMGRYIALLGFSAIVLYLLPFVINKMPGYDRRFGTFFGPLLDYGYSANDVNADIVVFGDSSAVFGFDPVQVGNALNLKVINLPNTLGSLAVTQDDVLRGYLKHNKAPRLIVFYFAPWDLDFNAGKPKENLFEGEDILLRTAPASEIITYFRHYPLHLLNYPLEFYSSVVQNSLVTFAHHTSGQAQIVARHGHADVPAHAPSLSEDCSLPTALTNPVGSDTVDRFINSYRSQATQTWLYISPIPNCRNAQLITNRSYRGDLTSSPAALDPTFFALDYTHVRAPGVPQSSEIFTQALTKALKSEPLSH